MSIVSGIFNSSLGKKYLMAGSGALLLVFVIGHLVGNLQVFGPPELINHYAHFLQSKPAMVWGSRLGLLVIVGIHIATALKLTVENKEARPVGYYNADSYGASWRSRYMMVSGLVILAFIIYHLAHFTVRWGAINGAGDFTKLTTVLDGKAVPDVYAMMILGFQVWWVTLFYLVAQALLFIHLGHGIASAFQSFGFRNHVWWPRIQFAAQALSTAIFIGYALIPIAIYLRVIGADYAEKVRAEIKAGAPAQVAPVGHGKETH
jgi:succinate dehydrogenase / fumarate reductase cytochrome b subunit